MKAGTRVLIVDDDEDFCTALSRTLVKKGIEVQTANTPAEAVVLAGEFEPDWAIVDLRLGRESGLRLIEPLLGHDPTLAIIVLTAYGSIATAVEAIRMGARDYLTKPVDSKQLLHVMWQDKEPVAQEQVADQPISLKRMEWEHIHRILAENQGNISATARSLGMHRRTLQRKLQKHPVK